MRRILSLTFALLPLLMLLLSPTLAQQAPAKTDIHAKRDQLTTDQLLGMSLGPDIAVFEDIAYVENASSDQKLDVYVPRKVAGTALTPDASLPVVIFFHGGNWTVGGGEKRHGKAIASGLCEEGFIVVSVAYRGADRAKDSQYPRFVEDCAAAVAWVAKNIASYVGDPKKLFLCGHSAGGHLAALLAYDETWLAKYQLDASTLVKGLIGISGVYYIPTSGDATEYRSMARKLNVPFPLATAVRRAASPIAHIDAKDPPTLLFCGDDDLEHLDAVALGCWVTLRAYQVSVAYHVIEDRSHETILRDFGVSGDATTEKTVAFLKARRKAIAE